MSSTLWSPMTSTDFFDGHFKFYAKIKSVCRISCVYVSVSKPIKWPPPMVAWHYPRRCRSRWWRVRILAVIFEFYAKNRVVCKISRVCVSFSKFVKRAPPPVALWCHRRCESIERNSWRALCTNRITWDSIRRYSSSLLSTYPTPIWCLSRSAYVVYMWLSVGCTAGTWILPSAQRGGLSVHGGGVTHPKPEQEGRVEARRSAARTRWRRGEGEGSSRGCKAKFVRYLCF